MTSQTMMQLFSKYFGNLDLAEHDHPNMEAFIVEFCRLCKNNASGFTYQPTVNMPIDISELRDMWRKENKQFQIQI